MKFSVIAVAMVVLAITMVAAEGGPLVPCYFVFGDSLVDAGNNNGQSSLAMADYYPYGVDFPEKATGRFTNGRTTVDVISSLLGFENYIQPYATATGEDVLRGVNYASAAAGIREETGQQLGARVTMSGQVRNYQDTVTQIASLLGNQTATTTYLSQCICTVSMGSNDYLNNYFMPLFYSTSRTYTPEQFADTLINQYSQQLQDLYKFGARKIAVTGVGQVGCSPFELAWFSANGEACVERINSAVKLFNDRLKPMVDGLTSKLAGSRFIYLHAYGIFQDLIDTPSTYGINVTNAGCCGVGRNNGRITCLPGQTPCPNRMEYLFWDAFHPTEAANLEVGKRAFKARKSTDAYPFDIQSLAQL